MLFFITRTLCSRLHAYSSPTSTLGTTAFYTIDPRRRRKSRFEFQSDFNLTFAVVDSSSNHGASMVFDRSVETNASQRRRCVYYEDDYLEALLQRSIPCCIAL